MLPITKPKIIYVNGKKFVVDAHPLPKQKPIFLKTQEEIQKYEKMIFVEKQTLELKIFRTLKKNVNFLPYAYTQTNNKGLDYYIIKKFNEKYIPKDRRKLLVDSIHQKNGLDNIILLLKEFENYSGNTYKYIYKTCVLRGAILLNKKYIKELPNIFLYTSLFVIPRNVVEKFPFNQTFDLLQLALEQMCPELLSLSLPTTLQNFEEQLLPKSEENFPSDINDENKKDSNDENKKDSNDENKKDKKDNYSNIKSYLITGAVVLSSVILISYGLPPIISWFTSSSSTKTS